MSDSPETANLLPPEQPVDLTNCEREPIHIPSRIQPHGVLLTLREPDFVIVQASSNAEELLHVAMRDLLGSSLEILLQPAELEALQAACLQPRLDDNPVHVLTLSMGGGSMRFDAIAHRRQGVLVLELEPALQEAERQDTYALVRQAIPQIQGARTLAQMFDVVAQQVRGLNGFDRVMVYQFDADGHGSVVAESKRDDMEPFLGLHYPASDIPAQARRLYTLNLLRLIGVDVHLYSAGWRTVGTDRLSSRYAALSLLRYPHGLRVCGAGSVAAACHQAGCCRCRVPAAP
jgi:chemotaxis family two-component system sensor kinase Cph1